MLYDHNGEINELNWSNVVTVGLNDTFRLERSGCDKRKNIKTFSKGQSLFHVHRQNL